MYKVKTLSKKKIESLPVKLREAIEKFKEDTENFSEHLYSKFEDIDSKYYEFALKYRELKITEVQSKRNDIRKAAQEKEKERLKAEEKAKRRLTPEKAASCKIVIEDIRNVLGNYQPVKKGSVGKKKVTDILVDKFTEDIIKVVKREAVPEKVNKIKVDKFDEATSLFTNAFKKLRLAFSGISNDDDKLINQFENQMNQISEKIKGLHHNQ
ncbi:hypothetical protein MYP_668 [Sporocytophaga myxococcoides]|uniref:Uncharacterized protein n=1 Tax=Sporocytophaga myxococcoides TaxID=153721 RepID=A0A098L975_9BACT|nr:hypothetical protein [Sporocytophaga myxococcoides]GAL83441.1 hypothetical protein MYP_668 [Sporocytophaga myxococcoides]